MQLAKGIEAFSQQNVDVAKVSRKDLLKLQKLEHKAKVSSKRSKKFEGENELADRLFDAPKDVKQQPTVMEKAANANPNIEKPR